MAKYSGMIGYSKSVETTPGIYEDVVEEHRHYGDVLQDSRRYEESDKVNGDLRVSNRISIIADKFARDNMYAMKYLTLFGQRWTISKVDVNSPRFIISLGGLYNGPTPTEVTSST